MDFRILLDKITPALRYIARKHLIYTFYSEEDLFQEMCLYLWQHYAQGLPIGINEAYVIKGCEFHILNFLRKGRPRFRYVSLDEPLSEGGLPFKETIAYSGDRSLTELDNRLSIDNIKSKGLTDKENTVLIYLMKGYTLREIAAHMSISHVMVLKYKKSIIRKTKK